LEHSIDFVGEDREDHGDYHAGLLSSISDLIDAKMNKPVKESFIFKKKCNQKQHELNADVTNRLNSALGTLNAINTENSTVRSSVKRAVSDVGAALGMLGHRNKLISSPICRKQGGPLLQNMKHTHLPATRKMKSGP
jgi:hypothetical protein